MVSSESLLRGSARKSSSFPRLRKSGFSGYEAGRADVRIMTLRRGAYRCMSSNLVTLMTRARQVNTRRPSDLTFDFVLRKSLDREKAAAGRPTELRRM